jgi:hypothetical protein
MNFPFHASRFERKYPRRKAESRWSETRDIDGSQQSSAPQSHIIQLASLKVGQEPVMRLSMVISKKLLSIMRKIHQIVFEEVCHLPVSIGNWQPAPRFMVNRFIVKYIVAIFYVFIHFTMFSTFIVAMSAR